MLEVKDLEVYYGAIHAVKGISLRVEDGQIVTLIGSNGAGKSTTLHTISGLIKPRSGNILFDGTDITGTPAHKIVASGLVQVPIWGRISARTRTALKKIRRRSLSSSPAFLNERTSFQGPCPVGSSRCLPWDGL